MEKRAAPDPFAQASVDVIAETDRLVRRHGSRLAGSAACRAVAEELAAGLRPVADSVVLEEFTVHPRSFYAYTKILPVSYVLGLAALLVGGPARFVPLVLLAAGICLMLAQFGFYRPLGDALFAARTGVNVEARIEPTGPVRRELIISGHHDSAPAARIFEGPFARLYAAAIFAPYVFYLLEGVLLALGRASTAAWIVLLAGLPVVAQYFLLVAMRRGTPGAGDNLVASVMAVRVAREVAQQRDACATGTRVRIVSFDAEEAGLRGAAAYFARHRAELSLLPCSHLNFDSLFTRADLQVLTSDINGTQPLDRGLVDTVVACARAEGIEVRPYGMLFGAGGTDAAESARCGIPSTTLIAMPTRVMRDGLVYHTRNDTADAIEPGAVAACMSITLRLLREYDAGGPPPAGRV
jgi:aminopeptidase YwaD